MANFSMSPVYLRDQKQDGSILAIGELVKRSNAGGRTRATAGVVDGIVTSIYPNNELQVCVGGLAQNPVGSLSLPGIDGDTLYQDVSSPHLIATTGNVSVGKKYAGVTGDGYSDGLLFEFGTITTPINTNGFMRSKTVTSYRNTPLVWEEILDTGAGTKIIPANYLSVGDTIKIKLQGSYGYLGGSVNGSIGARIRIGSTIICDFIVPNNVYSYIYSFEIDGIVTVNSIGVSGDVRGTIAIKSDHGAPVIISDVLTESVTLDTTIPQEIFVDTIESNTFSPSVFGIPTATVQILKAI